MKIKSKEVKECTNPDESKTTVLDLIYTHKGETGRVLIKDYDDKFYDKILKQIKKEVKKNYILTKEIGV